MLAIGRIVNSNCTRKKLIFIWQTEIDIFMNNSCHHFTGTECLIYSKKGH